MTLFQSLGFKLNRQWGVGFRVKKLCVKGWGVRVVRAQDSGLEFSVAEDAG